MGRSTIKRAELAQDQTSLTVANNLAIRHALEAAGVIFIEADATAGPGVRLCKRCSGEASQGPAVAAIVNAVAHATGKRLRELPLTPERIKLALG